MNDNNYVVMLSDSMLGQRRVEVNADYGDTTQSGDLVFQNVLSCDGANHGNDQIDEVFAVAKGKWDYYYKNDKPRNCPTNVEGL